MLLLVTVNVARQGTKAVIIGSNSRTIGSDLPLLLDGSLSTDLDYPSSPLQYLWSCFQLTPQKDYGKDCFAGLMSNQNKLLMSARSLF